MSFGYSVFRSFSVLAVALISAASTVSCTKKSDSFRLAYDTNGIISTRPDVGTEEIFMVKLKSSPLLAQAANGKIEPAALKAINEEQEAVLKQLQALSADIHVIYRYRMVLNGFSVLAPTALQDKIGAIAEVAQVDSNGSFSRPILPAEETTDETVVTHEFTNLVQRNSVKFIGGEAAHAKGIRGQGIKVGVIDSGIDYTHAMFGGTGTEAAYKAVKPDQPDSGFPNAKVVGGIDLVGTEFNSASPIFANRIPKVDANPLDEGGHGTHVAGTIAGKGDGVNSYNGVAPDATLFSLKVFGADGSTSDNVVIAALEYAADPNSDGDTADKLDVVNLSLGSGYGSDHILYSEAIKNSTIGGTVVVASAGNSGDSPYIVGSPGATTEAISVAASVDDMDQNWRSRACRFSTPAEKDLLVEAVEGAITKPLSKSGSIVSELVYVGTAAEDFNATVASSLKGKIALIDRGVVPFADKIKRAADAGSVGVVVANNQNGAPIQMGGGDGTMFLIPGIMVTKEFGDKLKAGLQAGTVTADLVTNAVVEYPERIDTMAGFSSRGPRSIDGFIKPEIAAPGNKIISAKMGGGDQTVQMNGTSMASPHMAGVMALMKQAFPKLTASELKSVVMGSAKTMIDEKKALYPVARQGAGRVQIMQALAAQVVTEPQSISLGEITLETAKTMSRQLRIKNISAADVKLQMKLSEATPGLKMSTSAADSAVELKAGAEGEFNIRFTVNQEGLQSGQLLLTDSAGTEIARVPVLAVATPVSLVAARSLVVNSTSELDSQGAVVDLALENKSQRDGSVMLFNLLGRDARKPNPTLDPSRNTVCDLEASGYRVITKKGVAILQVAAKVYEPVTTWDLCEISVLIDTNGDLLPEQELAGIKQSSLEGQTGTNFVSVLLDAAAARTIRKTFDIEIAKPRALDAEAPKLDFTAAVESIDPMQAFGHSTITVVEVPVAKLKLRADGTLAVRIATSAQIGSVIEPDDYLVKDPKHWTTLAVTKGGAGYLDMPEEVSVKAGQSATVSLTKGAGREALWMLRPNGRFVLGGIGRDQQSEVLKPVYVAP